MNIAIFGLTVSSSWGNGHATLWRGLIRALAARGHDVCFFERDVPYYAGNRDLPELPWGQLRLYPDAATLRREARAALADADVAIVTSYCPDGRAATQLVLDAPLRLRVFYDLDTPVTLGELASGRQPAYIGPRGLRDFDLVLSFTGGQALTVLRERLGARRVAPLYGHVDPDVHHRVAPRPHYRADLSYLGTYAADRQAGVQKLLITPARLRARRRFVIGGAQYPTDFPWTDNIYFVQHLPPEEHAAFFSSARLTLNVTRRPMAEMGYCPSGRLFEAAACGAPLLSDDWEGLDEFFRPGHEILVARGTEDALAAIDRSDAELERIARAARERTLDEYTSDRRARQLERWLEAAHAPPTAAATAALSAAAGQGG